jgi:hypothetical protein
VSLPLQSLAGPGTPLPFSHTPSLKISLLVKHIQRMPEHLDPAFIMTYERYLSTESAHISFFFLNGEYEDDEASS